MDAVVRESRDLMLDERAAADLAALTRMHALSTKAPEAEGPAPLMQEIMEAAVAITGDAEAAADLLQDVFLRLHRFAGHIDPLRPLEPWLYRMTTNLSYTWVKRRQRWLRPLEDVADWWREKVGKDWLAMRNRAMELLSEESRLSQIVKLVGPESRVPFLL